MKKLLLFIALTIFGLGLNAQSITIDYDGYSLEFSVVYHGNCYVSGYSGTPVDVTIPSSVEFEGTKYNVTSIGEIAFQSCSSLTSIEIPNSVTSIGESTFSFCSSLTSIEIPNSVTSIGSAAFWGCSSLTSIEIPNSVTSIGDKVFSECSSLTSIVVAEGNTVYDSRENCNAIIETSSNKLIAGCQNTVIPNSVTSIVDWAFEGCSSLTSIEIPNSVTSIGAYAFWNCSSLTSIEIPNSVTSIGEFTFSSCSSLTSIEIPNSVTYIGESAFWGCSSLTSIEIPNSVTYIGEGAFSSCSSLTSIEIPNSVTSIGGHTFYGCSSLTSIEIPNSVTYIGEGAFWNCSSLSVIKCDAENVPETGDDVFYGCPSDMTIYVPRNLVHKYRDTDPWSNYIITGVPKVAVSANNKNYGTAEGGGLYDLGEKVTVKAIANPYCYFINWTENDNVVSTDAEYAFYINSDRNLVANFAKISVPENFEAKAESSSSILLTWDEVENAESYNIYQDDELIDETEETEYLVEDLEADTKYCFYVTAVNGSKESDESDEDCDRTDEEDEESLEELSSSINIYPNPVENELFIATELRVEEVSIYDVYGRQTMSQQVNETTSQQVVDVADLDAGVYFVNIKTENGNVVKRFVKN